MEGGRRDLGSEIARSGREAGRLLVAAAFPHFCCVCGTEGPVLCSACAMDARTPLEGIFVCPGCGERTPLGARCLRSRCAEKTHLDGLISVAPYGRPVLRELLRMYKYERVDEAGEALLGIFDAFVRKHLHALASLFGGAAIVPVPVHRFREAYRGFNQSEPFAAMLASALGARLESNALRRRFRFRAQAALKADDERRSNARRSVLAAQVLAGSTYVLVDDVVTSGATLEVCAAALKDSGAGEVWAVTLLKGAALHKKGSNR